MEQAFSYQFQSVSTALLIFGGLTLVGAGLGFMFWLDFRKRFSKGGDVAGFVVLVAGSLVGAVLGYQATQPAYFKKLTANDDGIRLEYYLFAGDVLLRWSDVEGISVQENRLIIEGRQGADHRSPVVYRGDQARLLQSLARSRPGNES